MEEQSTRTYAVAVGASTFIVRARSNRQAVGFIARQEEQRVRDLASVRVATFDDGLEAERHGVQVLDATRSPDDPHQIGLGGL